MAEREAKSAVQPQRATRNGRRDFRRAHKQAVVGACLAPDASVAAVSMAYGFNANLVRRWIRQAEAHGQVPAALEPVTVDASAAPVPIASRTGGRTVAPSSAIEFEYADARLVVRGGVDSAQLHAVLEALARHR